MSQLTEDRFQPVFKLMGVINVTPDSFSDGGLFIDAKLAIEHGMRLVQEGAEILDVGGESTRPGAQPVGIEEELNRVLPVIEGLSQREVQAQISVDTSKFEVAEPAVAAGASYINDITAFRASPQMAGLVAEAGLDCCLMHMQGVPATMQAQPQYESVVDEVVAFLEERLNFAVSEGIPQERVMLDPGIGFGKSLQHNLALLRSLDRIVALGCPVVVGLSRKSFLGAITNRETDSRVAATLAANVAAYRNGARVFRVHDVAENRDALRVAAAVFAD